MIVDLGYSGRVGNVERERPRQRQGLMNILFFCKQLLQLSFELRFQPSQGLGFRVIVATWVGN